MSVQFFEKALASFKKANLVRREKLAKAAGYAKVEDYQSFLEGMIGAPSQTLSEVKKETKTKAAPKAKAVPKIVMVDILDASISMGYLSNKESKISKAKVGIQNSLKDLKESKEKVEYFYGISVFSEARKYSFQSVRKLDESTTIPNFRMGDSTALNDAIGKTLTLLKEMKNSSDFKDAKILVNIYTDGEENSSREFKPTDVFKLITELEKKDFTITFVGTQADVAKVQTKLSIDASNTLAYDGSSRGLETAMATTASAKFKFVKAVMEGKDVTRGFYKNVIKK